MEPYFKLFSFSTDLHCIGRRFLNGRPTVKGKIESCTRTFRPWIACLTWRVVATWHCYPAKVIIANYPRESGECAKSSSRARRAGTVLDSQEARSRARHSVAQVVNCLGLARKCETTSTTRSPPRDLCHEAVFTLLVNVDELRIVSRHAPDV